MMIRTLSAFLVSTGALWATAGQSLAHDFDGDGILDDDCDPNQAYDGNQAYDPAYGQGYDPSYAPTQGVQSFGPARVVAGPLGLDVIQSSDGRVSARVVQSQVPLEQLRDTRLVMAFQNNASQVSLYYSPSSQAYFGTLPSGSWIGATPTFAQVVFPQVVVAPPPPVVHVVPYPQYQSPVVVRFPRRVVRPRVVMPFFRNPAPPAVVRVDPRGSWQRAHVSGRFEGRRNDGHRDFDRGRGHDGRGHDGRGHDGRGNGHGHHR